MPTASLALCSPDAATTQAVAATVARHLAAGDLVALTGELGAGKTCFVQGAARELGVREPVRSPSFMLRRDYEGSLGITHLDVYRLDTLSDVLDLGHDDPGQEGRVTFIEWGDAIRPLLPPDHLEVEFRLPPPLAPGSAAPPGPTVVSDGAGPAGGPGADAEPRTLVLRAHGPAWLRRIEPVAEACRGWVADRQDTR